MIDLAVSAIPDPLYTFIPAGDLHPSDNLEWI
jgi:hypothetical protein